MTMLIKDSPLGTGRTLPDEAIYLFIAMGWVMKFLVGENRLLVFAQAWIKRPDWIDPLNPPYELRDCKGNYPLS